MIEVKSKQAEFGSFRDRSGQVFYQDGAVLRGVDAEALADWEALSSTGLYDRLHEGGKVVTTRRVDPPGELDSSPEGTWAGYLEHERIPFVSYPYEWSFGMLKDAALLQLELLQAALEQRMTLKDASAYNVQWRGAQPVFIDIPSFQRYRSGEPWAGYRQFCEMFLNPLLLQAYKDVDFHAWMRGNIDGIPVEDFARLLSVRDRFRPGVLKHVSLQARLQTNYSSTDRNVKNDLRNAGFGKELINANARGLTKLVQGLNWRRAHSTWANYADEHSYTDESYEKKVDFVRQVAASQHRRLVWDLGCNVGHFSRIAAEHADYVVAMDADHVVIERLYQALRDEGSTTILPLVTNLADPSPALGWRLQERKPLADRGQPDLTLCLALIHHMVIGANIPLAEYVSWLAELGTDLVIEFVTKADPMVQTLLRNKDDQYADYDVDVFEAFLSRGFHIERREWMPSGTRVLYFARNTTSQSQ